MRIYIRHAEKQYNNGKSENFGYDPGITEEGKRKAREHAKLLVQQWGIPDIVVCSPYKRARETAIEMISVLDVDRDIKCDIRLSEYLGNHRYDTLNVESETMQYNPPHPETFFDMQNRVWKHNDDMRELDFDDKVVWFITHGIIINIISNAMGFKLPRKIPYLGSISFKSQNNTIESGFYTPQFNMDTKERIQNTNNADNNFTAS